MLRTDPDVPAANPYDVVRYPTFAFQSTHPGKLAAMAILHGLQPVPVSKCRVLEIGCNAGANVIPMAYGLPDSEFVGFDLAAAPILSGQEKIRALGLTNIKLLQADLMATESLPELAGKFDYIIAHGVYAWVPQAVRDGLLAFCRQHLSEHGVAFISYAALPGGHVLMLTRDIMTARGIDPNNIASSVRESIDLVRFVAANRPEEDGYRLLLETMLEKMNARAPEAVFHDELAGAYQPVLFREFARHTTQHGLSYFSEASLPGPVDPCYQADAVAAISKLAGGDSIVQEQIMDFIRMRQYRESLLCHAEQSFASEVDIHALPQLWMSSSAKSSAGEADGARIYTAVTGARIEAQHPATLAVMECLIERYPESVTYSEIAALAGGADGTANVDLLVMFLRLVVARMIDLSAWNPTVAHEVSERPVASLLARLDIADNERLTTLLHTMGDVTEPVARRLIPLLDGSRDRAAILDALSQAFPEIPPESMAQELEPALQRVRRIGLMVAG